LRGGASAPMTMVDCTDPGRSTKMICRFWRFTGDVVLASATTPRFQSPNAFSADAVIAAGSKSPTTMR